MAQAEKAPPKAEPGPVLHAVTLPRAVTLAGETTSYFLASKHRIVVDDEHAALRIYARGRFLRIPLDLAILEFEDSGK